MLKECFEKFWIRFVGRRMGTMAGSEMKFWFVKYAGGEGITWLAE
jgi:hypothetical protein